MYLLQGHHHDGDVFQSGPLVTGYRSNEFADQLGCSFFKRLLDVGHPQFDFTTQYRTHPAIWSFAQQYTYAGVGSHPSNEMQMSPRMYNMLRKAYDNETLPAVSGTGHTEKDKRIKQHDYNLRAWFLDVLNSNARVTQTGSRVNLHHVAAIKHFLRELFIKPAIPFCELSDLVILSPWADQVAELKI